ncbi:MAG: DUF92 domain-containing protein [Chloroflexi bacterium]|nr:DUF92 domain-containing protein [Chloroflexota bacterium]
MPARKPAGATTGRPYSAGGHREMVNPGSLWVTLAVGLVLSGVVGGVALQKSALSRSGFVGALLVGTITFGLGGPAWGIVLVGFFVSSSLLSHFGRDRKSDASREQGKGSRRDVWQVLANGGLGALLATSVPLGWGEWAFPAFVGSIAAVTADTWATEIGTLSSEKPRLITTWRRVPGGTSGAISPLGTAGSLLGAIWISLMAAALLSLDAGSAVSHTVPRVLGAAIAGGLIGSVADSFAGATIQSAYFCEGCAAGTERTVHGCGCRTAHVKGLRWVDNEVVNFLSSAAGAVVAGGVWLLF